MSKDKTLRRQRCIIVGLIVALVFAVVGVGIAQANVGVPTTIHTCTKIKSGATKVRTVCSPKQVGKTWADSRYFDLLKEPFTKIAEDFTGLDLSSTALPEFTPSPCCANFSGDNFTKADLLSIGNSNFTGVNFTGAGFVYNGIDEGHFDNDTFTSANFTNAIFINDSTGVANFDFTSSTFIGAVWNNTTCPDGTNSNSDGGTCVGHGIP